MKNGKERFVTMSKKSAAGVTLALWMGSGAAMGLAVQGPTFVIEFLNMQADSAKNPANHIHSAWRRIKGDFGLN